MAKDTIDQKFNQLAAILQNERDRAVAMVAKAQAGQFDADNARSLLRGARNLLAIMTMIPRTAAIATRAVELWNYQGGTLAADFTAIEEAVIATGNWIAARDTALWTNYDIAAAAPWAETVPTFTNAQTSGLQTSLNAFIAAVDVFLNNIP